MNNTGLLDAGGIWSGGGSANLTLINTTVSGNSATSGPGGGLLIAGGFASITDGTIGANSADTGGGLWSGGILDLTATTV